MGSVIPYGNTSAQAIVSVSLSPAVLGSGSAVEQTFTVRGVDPAFDVLVGVSKPSTQAGSGIVGHRITAKNQIGITFANNTGGTVTPPTEIYKLFIVRTDDTQGDFP